MAANAGRHPERVPALLQLHTRGGGVLGVARGVPAGAAKQFYAAPSFESWDRTRLEREQTYIAETRDDDRDANDLGGGYKQVALDLMHAVVEVPSLVDANGARPVAVSQVPDEGVGLVTALKVVERATIQALSAANADMR